jgi:hypothetical protein
MVRAAELFERVVTTGESAVDDMIRDRESENLFLDFKRSSDDGGGARLSTTDRNNLAKAVAGFANSEGGVVIWGVDCSRDAAGADVAQFKVPLEDPARFVSRLESAISGVTVPPHVGARSHPVVCDDGKGFAATYVPKSDAAPHQAAHDLRYYIRAGSSFVPAPHAVLAGLFGRRPSPNVFHNFASEPASLEGDTIKVVVAIMVRNQGPGIATDPFLTLLVGPAGEHSKVRVEIANEKAWIGQSTFGIHLSLISKPEIRIPPEAHLPAVILHATFRPPFDDDFQIRGTAGAGNSPPHRFNLRCSKAGLETIYQEFVEAHRSATVSEDLRRRVASQLFGVSA